MNKYAPISKQIYKTNKLMVQYANVIEYSMFIQIIFANRHTEQLSGVGNPTLITYLREEKDI